MMAIIFAFVWGSAFLGVYLKRYRRGLDSELGESVFRRLQEDMDDLGLRLNRVEEDLRFFGELKTPDERRPLGSGGHEEDE